MSLPLNVLYGITSGIIFVVLANWLNNRLIIKTAEKRLIKYLDKLGLKYLEIRRTEFLNVGDFKDVEMTEITSFYANGRISLTYYRYLDFIGKEGKKRTVTVRISWHLFKRTRIDFQPDIKKYAV